MKYHLLYFCILNYFFIPLEINYAQNLMIRQNIEHTSNVTTIVDLDHDQEWLMLEIPNLKFLNQKKWQEILIKNHLDEQERDGWIYAKSFYQIINYKKHLIKPKADIQHSYFLSFPNHVVYSFQDHTEKSIKKIEKGDLLFVFFSRKWSTTQTKQSVEKNTILCDQFVDLFQYREAIELAKKNLLKDPNHVPTILCMIRAYLKNDQNSEEIYNLSTNYLDGLTVKKSIVEEIEFYYWKAIYHERVQEFDKALENYQKINLYYKLPNIEASFIKQRINLLSKQTFTKLYFSTSSEKQDQKIYPIIQTLQCMNPPEDTSNWTNCSLMIGETKAFYQPMTQDEIDNMKDSSDFKNLYPKEHHIKCGNLQNNWQKVLLVNDGCIYYVHQMYIKTKESKSNHVQSASKIKFKDVLYIMSIMILVIVIPYKLIRNIKKRKST
jgi:tetratricopeptide (TPR) repeat protein